MSMTLLCHIAVEMVKHVERLLDVILSPDYKDLLDEHDDTQQYIYTKYIHRQIQC